MTLRDHIRLLREHWPVIIGCLILGVLGAAAVTYSQPPSYSAAARMYVASQIAPGSASDALDLADLSAQRVRSYQELVRSERIGQEVVARLGLPLSAVQVRQKLSADVELDTVVLTITVTDDSPVRAADIANAAAGAMVGLVAELERLPDPAQLPPLTLRIVEPASPPLVADWPNPPLNLAAGGAFGLLVGVGLSGLRRALDDSVRTAHQLRSLTGVPVLGALGYSPKMAKRPLSLDELRRLPQGEAVRHTRTRLQLLMRASGVKVVGITSAVPDDGQTAMLCNLAVAMADAGRRVVVVEADLRRPTLAQYFGLWPEPGLRSVVIGHKSLAQAVQPVDRNLDVLTSAHVADDPTAVLSSRAMTDLLVALRQRYDIVLVDVPPVLSDAAAALVAANTDGCVLVVRYGRTTAEEAAAATAVLASASVRLLGTFMTKVPRKARIRDIGSVDVAAPADTVRTLQNPGIPVAAPVRPNGSAFAVTADGPPQSALKRRPSPRPRNANPGDGLAGPRHGLNTGEATESIGIRAAQPGPSRPEQPDQ